MKIIACDELEGTVTYEIEHDHGVLRERLPVQDYKTADEILGRIEEREKQIAADIKARAKYSIPDEIKAMIETAEANVN